MIGLGMLFLMLSLKADGCTTVTLYSRQDWVAHDEFLDVEFSEADSTFLNSQQILTRINALGTFSWPRTPRWQVLAGQEMMTVTGNENPDDPNLFSITFGKKIRVEELTLELAGWNGAGQPMKKTVWINAVMEWVDGKAQIVSGTPVDESSDKRQALNLEGQEISNIIVMFEDSGPDCHYQLSGFQIHHYQTLEHVEWTETPIPGAPTRQIQVCLNGGTLEPNGTDGIWKREETAVFTPSASQIYSAAPQLDFQQAVYDYGRGAQIPAYSLPDVIRDIDPYAYRIRSWQTSRIENYQQQYWSVGEKGERWPWIETAAGQGVRYLVTPVYWTQRNDLPAWLGVDSDDGGWCEHTTGSRRTPCYKYAGHNPNSRLNSYDVMIQTYRKLYDPEDHQVIRAVYSLINSVTGQRTELAQKNGNPFITSFSESGRWRLEAQLQDESGNQGTVLSQEYLIDNLPPSAAFIPGSADQWFNRGLTVTIQPQDEHSGIQRWRWALSRDGGAHFGPAGEWIEGGQVQAVSLDQNGWNQLRAELIDNAGNRAVVYSDLYKIDLLAPVTERSWVINTVNQSLVDDSAAAMPEQWLNASARLKLFTGKVNDRPELFSSGVASVQVKTTAGIRALEEEDGIWQGPLSEIQGSGRQSASIEGCDKAGNCQLMDEVFWLLDPEGPLLKARLVPEIWTNQDVQIQIRAEDALSGTAWIQTPENRTEAAEIWMTATENGDYPVSAADRAGNESAMTVSVRNIDREPPGTDFSPSEAQSEDPISVVIQPWDTLSGVRRWRYRVSYDEGQTFLFQSEWFENDQPQTLTLELPGTAMIETEVFDQAGNQAVSHSGTYILLKGDAALSQLWAPVCGLNETEQMKIRVQCEQCDLDKNVQLSVYQDDRLIAVRDLPAQPDQEVTVDFTMTQPESMIRAQIIYDLDRELKNNELILNVRAKSYETQETSEARLDFKGPVMFAAIQGGETAVYQEQLTLASPIADETYFAGQGIEADVTFHYYNECADFRNWACLPSEKLSMEESQNQAEFDQGALPVRNHYAQRDCYIVPLIQEGNQLRLPQMWATLHEGMINDEPDFGPLEETDRILDAGHRWYTDPETLPVSMMYKLNGKDAGLNHFSWTFLRQCRITQSLKEQYRIHFVNPQDPTTWQSPLWSPYHDWFGNLIGKTPIAEIREDALSS